MRASSVEPGIFFSSCCKCVTCHDTNLASDNRRSKRYGAEEGCRKSFQENIECKDVAQAKRRKVWELVPRQHSFKKLLKSIVYWNFPQKPSWTKSCIRLHSSWITNRKLPNAWYFKLFKYMSTHEFHRLQGVPCCGTMHPWNQERRTLTPLCLQL